MFDVPLSARGVSRFYTAKVMGEEAAQSVGVHRSTVHHWIHSPHFRHALARARETKALFWREESERLAAEAVETILALMTEPSTPAGVRLKAAQFILSLAMAPPPEQPAPSLLDLLSSPLAAGQQPPVSQTVHNSAQSITPEAAPEIVHNSARLIPEPPASETMHSPAGSPPGTINRSSSKVGRNDLCPCGSGKKSKRCCPQGGGAALGAVA